MHRLAVQKGTTEKNPIAQPKQATGPVVRFICEVFTYKSVNFFIPGNLPGGKFGSME